MVLCIKAFYDLIGSCELFYGGMDQPNHQPVTIDQGLQSNLQNIGSHMNHSLVCSSDDKFLHYHMDVLVQGIQGIQGI